MSNLNQIDQRLANIGFHGSYRPQDITFLLNITDLTPTSVAEKERLIQSGQKHYSEMISEENAPSPEHLKHFQHAFTHGSARLAQEVQQLSQALMTRFPKQPIVLVSLVRAGVPLGVLLKHCIAKQQACFHYGISIIRDRGIDFAALNAIIQQHGAENIVFVDGWTGKGAICRELTKNLQDYPELFDAGWEIPRLVTLSDLGGYSWLSASCEDWLIPFGILGSVISGLTSRSILRADIDQAEAKLDCFNPEKWHDCVVYTHLQQHDLSVQFIQNILNIIEQHPIQQRIEWNNEIRLTQQKLCLDTVDWIAAHYQINNINHIKPSIAEATRAVLRRVPERILIRDEHNPHVQLLLHFAQQQHVSVDILGSKLGPYHAVTLIKNFGK
ncbi:MULTISPECIES: cysteine protease StiP domain-containing protein [Acinetobacter]|uniref:Cysteine protease StiP family protein n=1 Tax=Acinetobacter piscicola TaxID=2006115 RepID=A0A7S7AHS6_9GAMM|nr:MULTISPECIES: cysteine protease StiP domain-containing protein [Acinetobacter]QOW46264.1 cysteine protease StiP family protein [Acinetobacter piscicola]